MPLDFVLLFFVLLCLFEVDTVHMKKIHASLFINYNQSVVKLRDLLAFYFFEMQQLLNIFFNSATFNILGYIYCKSCGLLASTRNFLLLFFLIQVFHFVMLSPLKRSS